MQDKVKEQKVWKKQRALAEQNQMSNNCEIKFEGFFS